jgi:lipooligosaccharide transport system permease protein
VLFSSAFPGMYGTFLKYRFQRTYDAFLAAPVDVDEIVSAEILWIGLRAGVYGNVPLLVAIAFGLDPRPTALLVPLICFVTGAAFVAFGVAIAATAESIDNFSYITSGVLTPMFLTAGTFFPISSFPPAIEALARVNPLYHCVQLVRDVVVLGIEPLADLGHLAFLVAFGLLMWRVATWRLGRRLID